MSHRASGWLQSVQWSSVCTVGLRGPLSFIVGSSPDNPSDISTIWVSQYIIQIEENFLPGALTLLKCRGGAQYLFNDLLEKLIGTFIWSKDLEELLFLFGGYTTWCHDLLLAPCSGSLLVRSKGQYRVPEINSGLGSCKVGVLLAVLSLAAKPRSNEGWFLILSQPSR